MPDENRYDDIIGLPHPTSKKHPPMSRLNRAAQFAPFAALTGYGDAITEAARLTEERQALNEADQLRLGEKLALLQSKLDASPAVTLTYFKPDARKEGGEYVSVTGMVRKVRPFERELVLEGGEIVSFGDILDLDGELFDDAFLD